MPDDPAAFLEPFAVCMAGFQIAPVQRLRAAAALLVVIGHTQSEAIVAAGRSGTSFHPLNILPWGAGVDLFFVISGFIMVVASQRLFAQPGGGATFLRRRLKRIVPLYWLFTTLFIAAQLAGHKHNGIHNGIAAVVTSYLFIPRDNFADGIARPVFTLGWTLNYEMFFYALFALALRWPVRRAVATVAAVLLAGVVAGLCWSFPPGPLLFWTQPIVLEFALGMGLGLAWQSEVVLPIAWRGVLMLLGIGFLALDGMDAAHQTVTWITPTNLQRVVSWGVPCALTMSAAVLGRRQIAGRASFGLLIGLGDASYALYLAHPFIVGAVARLWHAGGLATTSLWAFVGTAVVISIATAFGVHMWLERPLARLLAVRLSSTGGRAGPARQAEIA